MAQGTFLHFEFLLQLADELPITASLYYRFVL